MRPLQLLVEQGRSPKILCLGAHCDDIAIGCGGTLLDLAHRYPAAELLWVVLTSTEERAEEELKAADALLHEAVEKRVIIKAWKDGFLPYQGSQVKEFFEELKPTFSPDLIFTHYRGDAHQDHRLVCELTWNTYRHHLILEYEIPKYDGDIGSPNVFVPLDEAICRRKIDYILGAFHSQHGKHWFSRELFSSILRLRGMEVNAVSGYAEGFYCRKAILRMEV
jgi:LmbE family N-acetylglucosaminyl deacetylase